MIDASAHVAPDCKLGAEVRVGAFTVIGPEVEIGAGTEIGSHVVIHGPTRIGEGNRIHSFSSIGDIPQDKKFGGEHTSLEIGDGNTIREFCTINRGTDAGGGVTRIGHRNWIMAYSHIAHDCLVGDDTVFANGASLAGHVVVEDQATLGGFALVHQFCRVGQHGFLAVGAVALKDVPPFVMAEGRPARPRGINSVGLERNGFDPQQMQAVRRAYRVLYREGLALQQAVAQLGDSASPYARQLGRFVADSQRGIIR